MPLEPTTDNLLAVASYGITGRIRQLIEVHHVLKDLHDPRKLVDGDVTKSDMRCKTCRTSSGKPDPWPCLTYQRFAEVLDLELGPAITAFYHAIGRSLNGSKITNWKPLIQGVLEERESGEPERPALPAA